MRFLLITILVCISTGSFAQKWEKLNYASFLKEYSHLLEIQPKELYNVSIKTSVYRTVSDPKPQVTQQSSLKVYTNNNYVFGSDATLQIQSGNLRLDIDTADHRVMLSDGIDSDLLGFKKGQFDGIDSTMYSFSAATFDNKRFLKVEEVQTVSSMQTVCFIFDKTTAKMNRLEMLYWPGNYSRESLDDESLEQPKVIMDYSGYGTIASSEELTKTVDKWLTKQSAKEYSCPQAGYTFHNLLEKKR